MTDRALLEDLARRARDTGVAVDRLALTVDGLVGDGRIVHERIGGFEARIARLEVPSVSVPPPSPLTSERVRGMLERPSKLDLEEQAKLAAEIERGLERDRKIDETHTLASTAATKADLEALASTAAATKSGLEELATKAASKDDVTKATTAFEKATQAQTLAILSGVSAAAKNPIVQRVVYALLGALLAVLATCSKPPLAPASQAQPLPSIMVTQ